jgi:hypothetical protein
LPSATFSSFSSNGGCSQLNSKSVGRHSDQTRRPPEHLTETSEPDEAQKLAELIQSAKWRFAWSQARLYPHEYTIKTHCSPEDHARLIACIEQYGVPEFFGPDQRKYFYFQERKYWHMGNPDSQNPDDWPNVINRCWVDLRKHAANVAHTWTPEEIQLQIRIWQIQLEKKAKLSPQSKSS